MSSAPSPSIIPLNHTEHAYVAVEGLAGSMGITYLLQFDAPVDTAVLRTAVRELVSAYPRFRGVIEPMWQRYRLAILDDGATTDGLFDHAWRVMDHLDADNPVQLEALHRQLINEVLPLERGLACRFHVIPHPQHPVLFVTVHHLLFDGRSALQFFGDLLKRLNGGPPLQAQPLEAASHLGALLPQRKGQWPSAFRRSWGHARELARRLASVQVQQAAPQRAGRMSTHMLRHHTVPGTTHELRALAKRLGLSFNSLVTLALAEAYLTYAPGDPRAAAVIRQSVDLRRYYPEGRHGPLLGNHVAAFLVIEQGAKALTQRAASVKAQVDEGMARFERREMVWAHWPMMIAPLLGRSVLGRFVLDMQRKGRMPRISCHASSLGNVAHIVPAGARVGLKQFITAVPSLSTLHLVSELNDRLSLPVIWQRCDASVEQMDDYLRRVDAAFERLREAARAADVMAAPAAATHAA